ncbi:MAG: pduE [Bacillota bacterium]|jgi:propanediol dehydratase small subunit|nr:pduE [Bacillota bacterium]
MDQEKLLKQLIEEVMKNMSKESIAADDTCKASQKIDASSYPLGEKIPDQLKSPTGKVLSEMTLEKLIKGELGPNDMRISPETLEMQAQVAESISRDAFARNLRRASELIKVPDDRLLEIYNALRPYRSTKKELYDIADELENKYGCKINSSFIRESADVYEIRGRLKKD